MAFRTTDLVKLNNLQLAGKLISDELLLGIHGSRRAGVGVEFEQYRHYEPGDDPKRIDWKLYARTQKHLVRESAVESSLHLRFLLDLSGSMNYAEAGVTRLDYAKLILASLAYLGYRQSDAMSLYGLRQDGLLPLVPAGKQAFQKILAALQKAEASGPWRHEDPRFPDLQTRQKELLILVSDFLQAGDEWLRLIQALAGPRREVVIFQVLGEQETDFDLRGFYRFEDLETGRPVEVQGEAVREHFRQQALEYLQNLDLALQRPHVQLLRVRLGEPLAPVLRTFLARRSP
ncbi:DUF58 domain-containing protein [Rhabdobacter roseus]|uniref:Uncharacterized protein (DUF58 family) n=1 Tax=Rhabdobacter roseus TaxID=1655419 RepID=A0A840TFN3_9BACT|nr:DUF58 domain-containing protein [Rhabdobacter roseus]MBB5281971.1 uncharacterized protein (DUF58 family) [Rhabdobacter roseus]